MVLSRTKFLDVAKLLLICIIITNFVCTCISDCLFENMLHSYLHIEITQQNFHIISYLENSWKLSFMSSLLASHGMCTFRTVIIHQPLLYVIYIISLTNFTPLTADIILLCMKKSVPNWWSSLLHHRKSIILCPFSATLIPSDLLYTH
jgi:hypothetical protein